MIHVHRLKPFKEQAVNVLPINVHAVDDLDKRDLLTESLEPDNLQLLDMPAYLSCEQQVQLREVLIRVSSVTTSQNKSYEIFHRYRGTPTNSG